MAKADAATLRELIEAAKRGAQAYAARHRDIVEDAGNEVALRWQLRVSTGRIPSDPEAWAFSVGERYAREILAKSAKK